MTDRWGGGDQALDEILASLMRERMGFGLDARGWSTHLRQEAVSSLTGTYRVPKERAESMVETASGNGDETVAEMVAWLRFLVKQGRVEETARQLEDTNG